MYCRHCGKEIRDNASFCPFCGQPVESGNKLDKQNNTKRKKKRFWIFSVLGLIVLLLLAGGKAIYSLYSKGDGESSGKSESDNGNDDIISDTEEAVAYIEKLRNECEYENALSELTEKVTTTVDGDTYYRLQQNYKGLPVYGRTVVCVADENGKVVSVNGNVSDVEQNIDLIPKATLEQLEESVKTYAADEIQIENVDKISLTLDDSNLCIYNTNEAAYLAYLVYMDAYELVVDANSAEVLLCSNIFSENAVISNKDGSKKVNGFQKTDGSYVLKDVDRNIYIYDAGKNTYWNPDNGDLNEDVLRLVSSTDAIFGNADDNTSTSDTAFSYLCALSSVYDYFAEEYHETGGGVLAGIYNDAMAEYNGTNAGGGLENIDVLPEQPPDFTGRDTIGIIIMGYDLCKNFSRHYDTFGHEYTHIISQKYASWTDRNQETGAIKEALSDIFGEIIEENKSKKMNWEQGSRIIHDPSKYNYPELVGEKEVINGQWIAVRNSQGEDEYTNFSHGYSTVISQAAWLMWNGINGNKSKKISTDNLSKLWYRSMLMMPSDCDFSTCRQLVEWAALSVDGLTKDQRKCISEAFDMVGIHDIELSPEILVDCDRNVRQNSVLNVYNIDKKLHSNYVIKISGKIAEHELAYASDILLDIGFRYEHTEEVKRAGSYPIDLPDGYYTFTISDKNNPKNTYVFTVSVSKKGTEDRIDLYTDFKDQLLVVIDPEQDTDGDTKDTHNESVNLSDLQGAYEYRLDHDSVLVTALSGENGNLCCELDFEYNNYKDHAWLKFEWDGTPNQFEIFTYDQKRYVFTIELIDDQIKLSTQEGFPFDEVLLEKSNGLIHANIVLAVENYFNQYEGTRLEKSDSYEYPTEGIYGTGFGELWEVAISENGKEKYLVSITSPEFEVIGQASVYDYDNRSKAIQNGDFESLEVLETFDIFDYFDFR